MVPCISLYPYPFYFVPWLAGLEGHLQLGGAQELGTTTHTEAHTADTEGKSGLRVTYTNKMIHM